jgi:hypothetical protein
MELCQPQPKKIVDLDGLSQTEALRERIRQLAGLE